MASKIEKASRQQRTFDPSTYRKNWIGHRGQWTTCANGYTTTRQAAQEQGQDNAGHGQDEGRIEEGQEISGWLMTVLEMWWRSRRYGHGGTTGRGISGILYITVRQKALAWQWCGWRGKMDGVRASFVY